MKEKHDVVVIGAGPAGGTASWFLAKSGLSVLLVEKKKAVGIPVTCAELLRADAEQLIPLPDYVIDHKISRQITYRDYVKVSESEYPGFMINRAELDKYVASQAVSEGAELSIGTVFKKFKKEKEKMIVYLEKKGKIREVECDILIGADGFRSSVAESAGLKKELHLRDYSVTYQYYMANVVTEEDATDFFMFVPYIGEGYAWIFPKRQNTANVGLGMRSRQGASPREILDLFLHQNPVAHRKCQNAFPLSQSACSIYTGGPLEKPVDDHVVIIGEAAGHVHPLTGEGNYFAILGATIAAEVCIKSFEQGDFSGEVLKRYEVECDRAFAENLRAVLKST